MVELDKSTQSILKSLYEKFTTGSEFTISAPEYQQPQIDTLVNAGLLEIFDASDLSGWAYIVRPTYAGQNYFSQLRAEKSTKAKHNTVEVIKWLIPTLISLAALIVAILK